MKLKQGDQKQAITVAARLTGLILNEVVGRAHTSGVPMPSHANLSTGHSSCCFPGDIMSYPFYDLYSYEPNEGEHLSKIPIYEFEHVTKKGRTCGL
jgi:hypothetical protein